MYLCKYVTSTRIHKIYINRQQYGRILILCVNECTGKQPMSGADN